MISCLQPATLVTVAVVLLRLTHQLVGYNTIDCYAPDQEDHYSACNVSYLERVKFHCPVGVQSTGTWLRNGSLVCQLESPVCKIERQLHYDDSGTYYCQTTNSNSKYGVNLTVLAPPFLMNVTECSGKNKNFCERSSEYVESTSAFFNVAVEYAGVGPFNVSWTLKGHELQCIEDNCGPEHHCCLDILPYKQVITIQRQSDYTAADEGYYEANVTNALGWNISKKYVRILCPYPGVPSGSVVHYTKHLMARQNQVKIQCNKSIDDSVELYMCYAPPGITFGDLNRSTSCAQCHPYWTGRCDSTITVRPDWVIARDTNQTGFCQTQRTTLTIPYVHKNDSGTVYCYYSYSQDSAQVYTTYDLSVDSPTHIPMIVGIVSGSSTLIFIVLALILAQGCYYRRQKRRTSDEWVNRGAIVGENGNAEEQPRDVERQPTTNGPPGVTISIVHDLDEPNRPLLAEGRGNTGTYGSTESSSSRLIPRHSGRPLSGYEGDSSSISSSSSYGTTTQPETDCPETLPSGYLSNSNGENRIV